MHYLEGLKSKVVRTIDDHENELIAISDWLKDNPEIGHRERLAAWLLSSYLEKKGFSVERSVAGMETAFAASSTGMGKRPVVALLAEYDALPEVGHGCGHNIIAASTVGAAVAVKEVLPQLEGTISVLGCPAEEDTVEGAGGKAIMVDRGAFDDVDFAMMVHPSAAVTYMKRSSSLSRVGLQVTFVSFPLSPEKSVSKAVVRMSSHIERLNRKTDSGARLKIDELTRGQDYAEMIVKVDAPHVQIATELAKQVASEANKIAEEIGLSAYRRYYMNTYADMIWNAPLSDAFRKNLVRLGEKPTDQLDRPNVGDEGNVSHIVPTICTFVRTIDGSIAGHSREYAEASTLEPAHGGLLVAAKALGMTTLDILADKDLTRKALLEFNKVSPSRSSEISLRTALS